MEAAEDRPFENFRTTANSQSVRESSKGLVEAIRPHLLTQVMRLNVKRASTDIARMKTF